MESRENDQASGLSRPKNRLPDSHFTQQQSSAWEPIINFRTVWKLLVVLGLVCLILGVGLLVIYFMQSSEIRIPYSPPSNCKNAVACANKLKVLKGPCKSCMPKDDLKSNTDCQCEISFTLTENLKKPVYMYYELENFHQNHRSYVKSRDDYQLLGRIFSESVPPVAIAPDSSCAPFAYNNDKKIYFPCGAIANSFFSDDFKIENTEKKLMITLDRKGISWESERKNKFKNPKGIDSKNYEKEGSPYQRLFRSNFTKPKDWSQSTYDEWWKNGALENEHFINWMHPASSSTFRKLYAIIENPTNCKEGGLCKGTYNLVITYRYDVDRFKGRKSVILSTTSVLGTPNSFLGWFTTMLGIVCIVIGVVFYVLERQRKSKVHPSGHRRSSITREYQLNNSVKSVEVVPEPKKSK